MCARLNSSPYAHVQQRKHAVKLACRTLLTVTGLRDLGAHGLVTSTQPIASVQGQLFSRDLPDCLQATGPGGTDNVAQGLPIGRASLSYYAEIRPASTPGANTFDVIVDGSVWSRRPPMNSQVWLRSLVARVFANVRDPTLAHIRTDTLRVSAPMLLQTYSDLPSAACCTTDPMLPCVTTDAIVDGITAVTVSRLKTVVKIR
jgi:hypothetical protein